MGPPPRAAPTASPPESDGAHTGTEHPLLPAGGSHLGVAGPLWLPKGPVLGPHLGWDLSPAPPPWAQRTGGASGRTRGTHTAQRHWSGGCGLPSDLSAHRAPASPPHPRQRHSSLPPSLCPQVPAAPGPEPAGRGPDCAPERLAGRGQGSDPGLGRHRNPESTKSLLRTPCPGPTPCPALPGHRGFLQTHWAHAIQACEEHQ